MTSKDGKVTVEVDDADRGEVNRRKALGYTEAKASAKTTAEQAGKDKG